jgi:TolA-binding protein
MRGLMLSVLMLAAFGAATGAASAQPGLSTGLNPEGADHASRIEDNARRALMAIRKTGVDALNNQDFATAEKTFAELVAKTPTTSDAHYLMGLAKLGLKNWAEAKQFLEIAVKQEPKRAEPKSRLGVAYVRLNEIDAAKKQREELAAMEKKCKGTCPEAPAIASNLALLDQVLAAKAP